MASSSTVVLYDVFEVHNTGPSTAGVYNTTVSNLNNAIPTVHLAPATAISGSGVDVWLAGIDENDPFRSEIDVRSSCILNTNIETRPPLQELHSQPPNTHIGSHVGSQENNSQASKSPPLKPRPLTALVERARSLGRGKAVPTSEDHKAAGKEDKGSSRVGGTAGTDASNTAGVQAGPTSVSSTADTKRRNRALGRSASARTQPTWHRNYATTKRTRSLSWSQSLLNRMSRLVDKAPGSSTADSNQCAVADDDFSQVGAGARVDVTDTQVDVTAANLDVTAANLDAVDASSDIDDQAFSHPHPIPGAIHVTAGGCGVRTSGLDGHTHNCPAGAPNRGPSDPSDSCSPASNDSNESNPTTPDCCPPARSESHPSHTPAEQTKALRS